MEVENELFARAAWPGFAAVGGGGGGGGDADADADEEADERGCGLCFSSHFCAVLSDNS